MATHLKFQMRISVLPRVSLQPRKGLGGQRIQKSFSEIEQQAEQQQKEQEQQLPSPGVIEDRSSGLDLGYREPKHMDPGKARQAERLGMGVGRIG